MNLPVIQHGSIDVSLDGDDSVRVFYRETVPDQPDTGPPLLLLHGFPSASHQFRRLMDAIGGRHRLIAPDYPGFGHTETPAGFTYSFDRLTDVLEGFVTQLGLRRFAMYAFDFGGPVGFRLATRHPERIAGLIVQNANAYDEGLSDLARTTIAAPAEQLDPLFTLPVTKNQYLGGTTRPELIAPDGWTLDQHFLDLPGRKEAQLALALDYHHNIERYPEWQRWLREHRPPTLIVWGSGDAFFPPTGAHAYLRDLPDARLHLFDTVHFALEESLPQIAPLIDAFLDDLADPDAAPAPMRIAVIGGTGHLGGAVADEAGTRGHRVTRLGSADVDVTDPDSVRTVIAGHDAVVVAVKGPDRVVPRGAVALLDALPAAGVTRLVFLGGGGSLEDAPGRRFVDAPDFPAQYRQTAQDQAEALEILRTHGDAITWTYVSPPPVHLVPGEKIGGYRTEARYTPITDEAGVSRISVGDYAAAVLDTVEQGTFPRQRITTAY